MLLRCAILLGALVAGAGCTGGSTASRAALPDEAPAIVGVITAREGERVRVEANPADSSGSDKAVVRLVPATRIVGPDGSAWPADSLRVGRRVRAWFAGPVAESYPVQATAAVIALESLQGRRAPVHLRAQDRLATGEGSFRTDILR